MSKNNNGISKTDKLADLLTKEETAHLSQKSNNKEETTGI